MRVCGNSRTDVCVWLQCGVQHQSITTEAINEQRRLGYEEQLSVYESFKNTNMNYGKRGPEMY